MSMTIHEFAERIGVSTATIWRALNGRGGISDETRRMVLRRMDELGYEPNQAARALVTGRSRMIMLWMPSLSEPYSTMVIHHVQEQVIYHDFEMIIRDMRHRPGHEASLLRSLQWPVDGMLVLDGRGEMRRLLLDRQRKRRPLVHMGAYYDRSVDCVGVDLRAGARAAVRHLAAAGCRRIAYLVPVYFNLKGDDRREGYLRTVREAGLKPEFIQSSISSRRGAAEAVTAYASERGCPDALFCFNDDHAIGAFRSLREMGLRVPEDVLLVGCDGIEDTEYLECRISTIVQPLAEMCALAWAYLERRIEDPGLPLQQKVLIPKLAVRESSTRPPHAARRKSK